MSASVSGEPTDMAGDGTADAAAATFDGTSQGGWYIVFMTGLVAIMSQIDRGVLALFVQPIKRDFHLSDTQVSVLLGFAFTFFYVVGGPPISRLADRGVRRNVIAGCLAVWSVATTLCCLAQNFWGYFFARAVVGSSEAGCGPASMSMIADAVPRQKLPLAYAIYNSGFIGGGALSLIIGGLLLGLLKDVPPIHIAAIGVIYNWQLVFLFLGLPGLLIALWFRLTVPEPKRRGATKPGGYSMKEVGGFVMSQRAMHLPFIIAVLLMSFQLYGLQAWVPAFFERTYGWGPAQSGPLLGLFGLVSAVTGLFLGAHFCNVMSKRYDDAHMRVYFISQTLAVPFGIAAPLMPNPWLSLVFSSLSGICGSMASPAYSALIQLTTPNAMRSQVTALYFILANAIAGTLGPTLVALTTDFIAHNEHDLRYVMVGFRVVLGPIAAYFMYRSIAPYRDLFRKQRDEEAARTVAI
ncbi:MFS transporter [Sphingobium nicotianae]|uniref:MFS transporter n=1 Tax=Sphingobium nicotianae TaxID=2782607 RepID=A0A9X1DC86_9SPHN|nr:MFS transporter [Sphingobium nicotianae]MBT2187346.1 MFS transporter [Sphingobium nicotianae]